MKKSIIFAKTSKMILIALIAAIMITTFCGCSAIPQKPCKHNYYLADYAESTASSNGFKKFTCSNCGNSYQEVIPAKEVSTREETSTDTSYIPEETTSDLTRKYAVNLFDLPVYSSEYGYVKTLTYSAEETDTDGWKHKDCYMLCGSTYENWYRYELNGTYTTVSGNLYDYNKTGGSGWVEFYDGENFLAATPKIDDNYTSVEFEIDITGVEYLTVHLCSTEPGVWMIADDIILTK